MRFGAIELANIHKSLIENLKTNNFNLLDYTHHLSSGFKSLYTQIAYEGIELIRQSCGGAGFSAHSGLPLIVTDYAPNVTFEGDNTVMAQQASRFIVKNLKNMIKEKSKPTGHLTYLMDIPKLIKAKCTATTSDQFLCLKLLDEALAVRAAFRIKSTFTKMS